MQQRRVEHARAGDVHVRLEVLRDLAVEARDAGEAVDAVLPEQQQFAPVAENDLQVGMPVERATHDQPERRDRGLEVPAPAESRKSQLGDGVEPGVRRLAYRPRRNLGVDEDRLPEGSRSREQLVVGGVIERPLPRSSVDHRADGAEARGPLEFCRHRVRLGHRQS